MKQFGFRRVPALGGTGSNRRGSLMRTLAGRVAEQDPLRDVEAPVVNRKQIYQKTAMGLEEIQSRRYKLPKRPRMLLILVDGRTPLDIVLTQAHALGIEDSAVYELIDAGFIAPLANGGAGGIDEPLVAADPETRFRAAQRLMNETAVNALGLRAMFFTLKLERCATLEDLKALLDDYRRIILKGGDANEAALFVAKVRSLIG